MEAKVFDALVAKAVEALPDHVRAKLHNVALLVEDEPSARVREEEGLGENDTLLGLYQGIPATERGSQYGVGETLPDTITIFRLPTLEAAQSEYPNSDDESSAVLAVVTDTLWHEIGHYFGLEEHDIGLREEAGTNHYHHE